MGFVQTFVQNDSIIYMYGNLNKLIVVVAAVMSHLFCRLEKVSVEVVRCREKDTPPVLNQMEFSGWVIVLEVKYLR